MKKNVSWITIFMCILLSIGIGGCGSNTKNSKENKSEKRTTKTEFLMPVATGENVFSCENTELDISNVSEGYFVARYDGNATKVKIMVTVPNGDNNYVYSITPEADEILPLSCGDGTYQINVCENIQDDQYAVVASNNCDVALADEYRPFLYPNTYVWYTEDSECVKLGMELSDESTDDLDFVERVYDYVISEIVYDDARAQTVSTDYVPDLDAVLSEKKGICFDYSALMSAILRSQGIPTKMVFGYSGTTYHAWISVYIEEVGWVDNIIEFNGQEWSLMDPTLDANPSNSEKSVEKYVNDSSHYIEKYWY